MKFYEKYYANNYDELITYYPWFYRDVFEMVEILKAHGRIADCLQDDIERTYLNSFLDYVDDETITALEKFLGVGLGQTYRLEERRRYIKAFVAGNGKVSASFFKNMISEYTESDVSVRFEPYDDTGNNKLFINVQCKEGDTFTLKEVDSLISRKIPAHIMYQLIETYSFEADSHGMEKLLLRRVKHHIFLPFWHGNMFDGNWLLDGNILLDAKRQYGLVLGFKFYQGEFHTTEKTSSALVKFDVLKSKNNEMFCAGVRFHTCIDFGDLPGKSKSALRVYVNPIFLPEVISDITVITKTRDYWLMDGTYQMNGHRRLNAVYRKETVE